VVALVQSPGKAFSQGIVKAEVYDGSRKLAVTAFGDNEQVSDIGRLLLSLNVGQRVEVTGSLHDSEKYGPDMIAQSVTRL
jgi:hypothetical protein